MAVWSFTNVSNPQPINNIAKYTPQEIDQYRYMKPGERFSDDFRLFGDASQYMCRFCGCSTATTAVGKTGFGCGYTGGPLGMGNDRELISLCLNFHVHAKADKIEQEFKGTFGTIVSSHPCSCHIVQLMKTGCICGGV